MTKFQRLHESAVFKTLGASSRTIATMLAIEYAVLGLLGGLVGALGSMALSWVITRHVLDIGWSATPGLAASGLVATVVLVGLVGVVSSLDVLRRKPLSVLRAE
jgi:putative ABC transport system permease protein